MDWSKYGGFFIEDAVGNNAFSYDERKCKKIYVAKLKDASIHDVKIGENTAFAEMYDGCELQCMGLENIYHLKIDAYMDKDIYLFDNHNHAFYFWCKALSEGKILKGMKLLHVDQHKDTRVPPSYDVDICDREDVIRYTTDVLNVGNFIMPAIYHSIFDDVEIVDSSYSLERVVDYRYVLDIDLDFFSRDMSYIDFEWRMDRVREYISHADVITIASSPYFIEQKKAIEALKMLFCIEKTRDLW